MRINCNVCGCLVIYPEDPTEIKHLCPFCFERLSKISPLQMETEKEGDMYVIDPDTCDCCNRMYPHDEMYDFSDVLLCRNCLACDKIHAK